MMIQYALSVLLSLTCSSDPRFRCDESAFEVDSNRQELLMISGMNREVGFDGTNEDGGFRFSNQDGKFQLRSNEFFSWGGYRFRPTNSLVYFRDGSMLSVTVNSIDEQYVVVSSRWWNQIKISRELLTAVYFWPDSNHKQFSNWHFLMSQSAGKEMVYLVDSDQLPGKIIGTTGSDRDSEWSLKFQSTTLGTVQTPLNQVQAIHFFKRPKTEIQSTKDRTIWFALRDGSRLKCSKAFSDSRNLTFELACGLPLETDPIEHSDSTWEFVTGIEIEQPGVRFLSAVDSVDYKFQPFWVGQWGFGVDRSCENTMMRASGATYFHGLGMHSKSRLVFELPKGFQMFHSELAIDEYSFMSENRRVQGSCVCRIWLLDDNNQWVRTFVSPTIRGGKPITSVRIELDGAKAIALDVDYADHGDVNDRVDWLNSRLIK